MHTFLMILIMLNWEIGVGREPETFVPATVPGACQMDIAKSENYPSWQFSDNYKMFGWMEDVDFTYRTSFDKPVLKRGESLWLCSKGIDYQCEISINGVQVATHEGALSPVQVRLDEYLQAKDNVLKVVILKAPKRPGVPKGREEASYCCKPPVSYEWDWHPRLIPSGIWDETSLVIRKSAWIENTGISYELSDDFSSADLHVDVLTAGKVKGTSLRFTLLDAAGNKVFSRKGSDSSALGGVLENPELWWTWDHGEPYVYTYEVELLSSNGEILDKVTGQTGFRRVRLVMNTDSWAKPDGKVKTRSDAPAQIELNGRRIFAKGSNWVAPEVFIGYADQKRYNEMIDLGIKANFNIFRCWGGCAPSKDAFYDECDRRGILVWQEFPLACNKYPDDPHYLAVLEQEARSIVRRIRNHPCLAILCGGNELFNSWSGMDDQALPLRLLNKICYELAPEIPFNMTSPLNGMAHGYYLFKDGDQTVHQWMDEARCTAYTEFGVPGVSPREVLEKIIPEDELFPVGPTTAWAVHHAFYAWDGKPATWIDLETIKYFFGEPTSLDDLIRKSSIIQGEGYKAIYEEARRQKPHCAMAMCWDFNEPWPAAANNSITTYPAVPKGCFPSVSAACRPICSSAKFMKYQWTASETLEFTMWLLNDTFGKTPAPYTMTAILVAPDGTQTELQSWTTPSAADNENIQGPCVKTVLPTWDGACTFTVKVLVSGHPEMDSSYTLAYKK